MLGIFDNLEFGEVANFSGGVSPDDLFSIWESLEHIPEFPPFDETLFSPKGSEEKTRLVSQKSTSSSTRHDSETELEASPVKRRKLSEQAPTSEEVGQDGQQRIMHITVERNRRKQMNEHLAVLRTLMPPFYVKRVRKRRFNHFFPKFSSHVLEIVQFYVLQGDQASIIGGVVDYIKELQQVLQSLEAKKQRKAYSEVLSPRLVSSPRTIIPSPLASSLSPRKPPLSPRVSLPASPRTPQPTSPYKPKFQHGYLSPTMSTSNEPSLHTSCSFDSIKDLAAKSRSTIANVEVKFSGSNVLARTISHRLPGQALKIVAALEGHSLEILHVSITTSDDTMINSFTIKVTLFFSELIII